MYHNVNVICTVLCSGKTKSITNVHAGLNTFMIQSAESGQIL